jgi:predicted nucleotide-binding protein (sugar kinase/HSP70/actin superfamily)
MPIFHRCHVSNQVESSNPLAGKKLYLAVMAEGSSEMLAAVFRRLGVEAYVTPRSDSRTLELGSKVTSGDECYPAKVVLGDLFRVIQEPGFDPARAAFFIPTTDGPCRFGQYAPSLKKVLRQAGYPQIEIISPTDKNGYADLGNIADKFMRLAWRAVVASDTIHRLLLKTRPYETTPGAADHAFQESLTDLCETMEAGCDDPGCHLRSLVKSMTRARDRFRAIPICDDPDVPLIGVVGEIFCRLNTFSNEDLIRRLESYGAQASLSHISEWIYYTNEEQRRRLRLVGRTFSLEMLGANVREHFQEADEQALLAPFREDFEGHDEPRVEEIIKLAWPYLPASGVLGEMVLSIGLAAYHALHGADGVIDISPFTCMNGIVSEAIYPKVSRDYGGIPIRNFYFDGTQSDLDRDLGIYLELARSYREKKPFRRHCGDRQVEPIRMESAARPTVSTKRRLKRAGIRLLGRSRYRSVRRGIRR